MKISHSLFPKKELEEKIKTWPGGMSSVMEFTTSKGVKLIDVGYKYNSSKVLCFVAKKSESTLPGEPYRARFVDDFENLLSRPVDHPEIILKYFQRTNGIDKHNQARQFELRLQKHSRMQNAWFHLATAIIGICVTDAWGGYRYAFRSKKHEEELPICDFTDRLAFELIHNNSAKDYECISAKILSLLMSPIRRTPSPMDKTRSVIGTIDLNFVVELSNTTIRPLSSTNNSSEKIKANSS